jgi:hypothetical protein
MSRTLFLMNPSTRRPDDVGAIEGAGAPGRSCPFASNCACVFDRTGITDELHRLTETAAAAGESVNPEVAKWVDRGWTVASVSAGTVTLERPRRLAFCINLGLTLVTGFLWLIYWIPLARNPRVRSKIITVGPVGAQPVTAPFALSHTR